jgi:hypothetical protein
MVLSVHMQISGTKAWFVELGDKVIYTDKLSASTLALVGVFYPMAATLLKVHQLENKMHQLEKEMNVGFDRVLHELHELKNK